ncbi:MAG: hypothetical protein K6E51_10715 [Treponema sp.]|nr:hypothetical protein [Treponema sp.]
MKKLISVIAALTLLTVVFGCKSTKETEKAEGSGLAGSKATVAKRKHELVDYQGATLGAQIPEWVMLVADGQYSQAALAKAMPDLKGKKVFVTVGRGDSLQFVRNWTDLVDVEVQVGDTMQRVVTKGVQASMSAQAASTGKEVDPTTVEQTLNMYKAAVSLVELNGLEKTASYWIENVTYEGDVQIDDYFEYYAVWTMDEKRYESQLTAAMKTVQENTSEGQALKEMIKGKLQNVVASSNDESVEEYEY